jgi:hypothetical protein
MASLCQPGLYLIELAVIEETQYAGHLEVAQGATVERVVQGEMIPPIVSAQVGPLPVAAEPSEDETC